MGAKAGLPAGVELFALEMHRDHRGAFSEVFRRSWDTGIDPVQWNMVSSEARVLRGVHVHVVHEDYLMIARGAAQVGLKDLRRGSPTEGDAAVVEMRADKLQAIRIPRGVAHGFYFLEPSLHLYAVSHYWNLDDELGCRWDDPELQIPWSPERPILSERDATAEPLAAMKRLLELHQPIVSWRDAKS